MPSGHRVRVDQEREEDVLGADAAVTATARLHLGVQDDPAETEPLASWRP